MQEQFDIPAQGAIDAGGARRGQQQMDTRNRIEDVTDRDGESYEEKMEEEYAKREGGA